MEETSVHHEGQKGNLWTLNAIFRGKLELQAWSLGMGRTCLYMSIQLYIYTAQDILSQLTLDLQIDQSKGPKRTRNGTRSNLLARIADC